MVSGVQTRASINIYVNVNGSDSNDGTTEKPFGSVAMAVRKARELRRLHDPAVNGGIHIIVGKGMYKFDEPLFIRPEDSGTEASPTWIEATSGEKVVFSGGNLINNWQRAGKTAGLPKEASGKVWVADAPQSTPATGFRQLWINDSKAIKAREKNDDSMSRILSWNHREQTCWIPKPATSDLIHVNGMEMVIHQWWAIAILRIKKMEVQGDSAKLTFYQPESRIQSEHPWPAPWISKETGNSAFYLTNALQFLDQPGEWYLDNSARKVYYWPRPGEDMNSATAIASGIETLVAIEGTIDHPVSYFIFKGIGFQHAGWSRPSEYGHVPHQAGMYMLDAYKLKVPGTPDKRSLENQAWVGRPSAAVKVNYADHTGFQNCRFEHLASTGLDLHRGSHDNMVEGNLFKDIGGTAVLAGVFSDEAVEVHIPYNPADKREVCSNVTISNNLVTNVTNEDWGCVGIGAGYVKNINIEHNEISDVSYIGISVGWGWTRTINAMSNNRIVANKIHHYAKELYDVAGIYTLSAQPGSVIENNYVDSIYKAPYAHDPNHWFYLYCDEGSSYFTVRNNWCPSEKFLQNANGPNNSWENNGPKVNDSVKQNAGLQAAYQHLLSAKSIINKSWPINRERPLVVELISEQNKPLNMQTIRSILGQLRMDSTALYQWENHYVIFDKTRDVSAVRGRLQSAFPGVQLKTYYTPFYDFNRNLCDDKKVAKEWDHIILTANLVADTRLQQEYMNYHATQLEKWPEVSKGFCNADFQQLLVYRSGRQLMLVISIPKGESLDKLNPRTTENNPRVDEWNKLMSKYQEGIEGTKPGEVWVFFKKL